MSTNKPKGKRYKCPYCDYRGYRVELIEHVEDKHEDMIPKDYTPARVVYNAINKKDHGSCMICHKETKWDEDKQRYDTLCGSKKCKDEYVKIVRSRMVKKYGTHNLLTDPNFQKKMLENRSISGKYKFEDGGSVGYVGSYEKKFLEFMDQFLHIKSYDIISPGPTIPYKYNGKEHTWITDFIYEPYNLVFDIKDGGDNPNTREMKDYREKQTAKEKAIAEYGDYNYIRLTDNKFEQLIYIFMELKEKADDKPIIRINESFLMEGTIITHSNNFDDVKKIVSSLSNKDRMQICNGTFKQSPYVKYRDVLIENDQPVSFIEVYELPQDKGVGYISVATVPNARRKGYSKLLVSKFLNSEEAKQFEVIAWKYYTGNDKSLNFAKSVGFDYEKDNTLYYEINESYLMEENNEYAEKYYEKMKQLSDEYGVEIYGRRSIDSDGSYYQKFLPTDNVMNEYDIESIISENTYVVSDLHFGKIKSEDNNTIRFLNKIPTTSTLLILGDIGYVKQPDLEYLRNCFSKIKCKNIFLVLGNHDCYGLDYYYSLGIKGIYEKILIKNKKWIFSHQPCDGPDIKWINFHGHIHEETVYKQVKDTKNKINCFYKNFDKPLKVKELIEWNKTSGIEKIILDESYIEELGVLEITFLTFMALFYGYVGYERVKEFINKKIEDKVYHYKISSSPLRSTPKYGESRIKDSIIYYAYYYLNIRKSEKGTLLCTSNNKSKLNEKVYLYKYNKNNLVLVEECKFSELCDKYNIKVKTIDESILKDRDVVYKTALTILKREINKYPELKKHSSIGENDKEDYEAYLNGKYDSIGLIYCNVWDIVPNARSEEGEKLAQDKVWKPSDEMIKVINSKLPKDYRVDHAGDWDDLVLELFHKTNIKESAEESITENYLISQDDIKFNFDLWKKNSDHNILFVTGLSGSGKSTLARKLAKEYRAEYIEFDMFTLVLVKGLDVWQSKVNDGVYGAHPLVLEYISQTKFTQLAVGSWDKLNNDYSINEHNKFVKWLMSRVSGDGKLYVLEGAQFFMNMSEESNLLIAGEPLIVTGTSMMKSWFRRYSRDVGDDKNLKTYMKYLKKDIHMLFKYYFENEKNLQDFVSNMSQYYNECTNDIFLDVEII